MALHGEIPYGVDRNWDNGAMVPGSYRVVPNEQIVDDMEQRIVNVKASPTIDRYLQSKHLPLHQLGLGIFHQDLKEYINEAYVSKDGSSKFNRAVAGQIYKDGHAFFFIGADFYEMLRKDGMSLVKLNAGDTWAHLEDHFNTITGKPKEFKDGEFSKPLKDYDKPTTLFTGGYQEYQNNIFDDYVTDDNNVVIYQDIYGWEAQLMGLIEAPQNIKIWIELNSLWKDEIPFEIEGVNGAYWLDNNVFAIKIDEKKGTSYHLSDIGIDVFGDKSIVRANLYDKEESQIQKFESIMRWGDD